MVKFLEVIYCDNVFSTQKLCVSSEVCNIRSGQFVLVNVESDVHFICQVYCRRDVNPKYCILNNSVIYQKLNVSQTSTFQSNFISYPCFKRLNLDKLTVIDVVNNFKSVNITVFFENANFTSKWKSKINALKYIVKEALKVFVVTANTSVFPNSVKACKNVGIYCIAINTTDCGFGKFISSTNLTIDRIISKNWFKNEKLPKSVGGVDNIYQQLKEYCMLERKRVDTASQFSNNVSKTYI